MNINNLSPQDQQQLLRLKTDFKFYARNCLKIQSKTGEVLPLIFNTAQEYLHMRLEEQLARTGMVRAVIVKGRQEGCSTYVEGRFFHKTQLNPNTKAFILTHHTKSTDQLFGMVRFYAQGFPDALGELSQADTQNRNQFIFSASKSSYAVGTAGSDSVGRGFTLQLFHGSEVAFWENTAQIATGALKAVNPVPGTEIILESTANGEGNFFHSMALAGLDPDSTYQTIFIPWYWQTEYRYKVPANFELTQEESVLKNLYNLDDEQIFWRRRTIIDEFEGEIWRFQQEYPNTLTEAFVSSKEAYFKSDILASARKAKLEIIASAPRILGVDVAGMGADKTALIIRQGRHIIYRASYKQYDTAAVAAIIAQCIKDQDVDRAFIDIGNAGPGVYDRLTQDYRLGHIVTPVNFGGSAIRNDLYQNKRAEMICLAKQWTETEGGVSLPDEDSFILQLMAHPTPKPSTVRGTLLFVPKEEIKKLIKRSPDDADAFFLTFAFPVANRAVSKIFQEDRGICGSYKGNNAHKITGGSKTMAHFRARQQPTERIPPAFRI